MSLTEKALVATLFQMLFVALLTAATCYALMGTYLVGVIVAVMIQVVLFSSSLKNWEAILKPKA